MQRTYPHGVTCWVDCEQADMEAGADFYHRLFGWTVEDAGPPAGPDRYLIAGVDGRDVAALAPVGAGRPPAWNTYVAVDDVDATAAAVRRSGGVVVSGPEDAGPAGRWALCLDPLGASFRLWQAGRRLGAQLVNAPDTWNFSDLHTPDRDAAMAFYGPLFGWVIVEVPGVVGGMIQVPGYGEQLAATVDPDIFERHASSPPGFADVIGGLATTGSGEPARWHVTFSVADRDNSAAIAERLGATTLATDENTWTRTALLRDPQGAEFTISQFTPPDGF